MTDRLKLKEEQNEVVSDWKFAAMVIDRWDSMNVNLMVIDRWDSHTMDVIEEAIWPFAKSIVVFLSTTKYIFNVFYKLLNIYLIFLVNH